MDLRSEWRDGISCANKLRASLAARLPGAWPDEAARRWADAAADAALAAWDGTGVAGSAPQVLAPAAAAAAHGAESQRSKGVACL